MNWGSFFGGLAKQAGRNILNQTPARFQLPASAFQARRTYAEQKPRSGVPYYLGAPTSRSSSMPAYPYGPIKDYGLQPGEFAPRRRRVNPTNIRAARRAVTRLRGVLKLLKRIERTMPHRKCSHGSARAFPFHRRRR